MQQRLFRSENHKVLGGVCAGLAQARGYSVVLTRMVALGLVLLSGMGLIVYLVCWVLLPRAQAIGVTESTELPLDPVKRFSNDKMIAGVCGGIARYLEMDASLLRIIYVCLVLLGGIGLLPYIYAWAVLPFDRRSEPVGL